MKRVAIYARVSTTNKQDNTRQIEDLKKVCYQHGYNDTQIDIYAENVSGYKKKKDRPQLDSLCSKVQQYSCIYTTEISRIGREPSDTRRLIDEWTDLNVPVFIKSLNMFSIENGKRNGIMNVILQVLIEYANIEAETLKERSKSGLLSKAKMGKAGGGASIAYGYMTTGEKGYLVVNPDEQPVIQQIFDLYKQGNGIKVISNILNEQKIPTRTNKTHAGKAINYKNFQKLGDKVKWSDKQVHDILRNPLYKGKRRFKGELLDAPAIISEEIWDECKSIMEGKTHRNYLTTYTYLLKDLCTCGTCQRNYFAKYKPVQQGDKVYICSSRLIKGGNCGQIGVNITLLESAIYNQIVNSDEVMKYISANKDMKQKVELSINKLQAKFKSDNSALNEQRKVSEKLLDLYLEDDDQPKEIYQSKKKEVDDAISNLLSSIELCKKELKAKERLLISLNKTTATKKMLIDAKFNRTQLQIVYKQLIHKVVITTYNKSCAIASLEIGIDGQPIGGRLQFLLDLNGMKKKPKVYRYKTMFDKADGDADSGSIFDDFDYFDWITIPDSDILQVQ